MTITMYDSIDLSHFPPNPEAVAGYVGGHWPTYVPLTQKFPFAHHLSIAVTASQRARCLDVEPGDASPAQALSWFKNFAIRDAGLPVLYASASSVGAVNSVMSHGGVSRDQYYIWSAHYSFKEHICSPKGCGYPQADATQWTDKALGRSLDQSCCADYFFGVKSKPTPPTPTPPTEDEIVAIAIGELNGTPHVFVEAKDGSVWYTWQKKGETAWQGGKAGVSPAGLRLFAHAPVK